MEGQTIQCQHKKDKQTPNDLQNTTQNTTYRTTRTPL